MVMMCLPPVCSVIVVVVVIVVIVVIIIIIVVAVKYHLKHECVCVEISKHIIHYHHGHDGHIWP